MCFLVSPGGRLPGLHFLFGLVLLDRVELCKPAQVEFVVAVVGVVSDLINLVGGFLFLVL